MKFGIGLPTCREGFTLPAPFATPKQIIELTKFAEKLGYDSVWADDHIVITPQMNMPDKVPPKWYDPLISLASMTSATKKIKLAVGVLCLPFRDVVILARQAATLDAYSNGRFVLGFGLGRRDEFEQFAPRMKKVHRGKLTEERIEAIYKLFTEDHVTYSGQYVEIQDISLYPKPVTQPPAIYLAGETEETYSRVARWGTGQLFGTFSPYHAIPKRIQALSEALESQGRKLSEIDKCVAAMQCLAKTHEQGVANFRKSRRGRKVTDDILDYVLANNAIGTGSEVVEKIKKFEREGIDHFTIHHYGVESFGELKEQLQMFAEEVMPHFK